MFGIDSSEFLLIGVVALVVIGPKDLPRLMRTAGTWIGKARRMSSHVRAGVDEMIRQAEATAGDVVPAGKLPTMSALLTTVLMTPDTRSREPGGEKSTVAPLLPSPLAASLAPPPRPSIEHVDPSNDVAALTESQLELTIFEEGAASQPAASPTFVTMDTRSREPGGAQSTVVPLRPGALAATFAPPLIIETDADRESNPATSLLVQPVEEPSAGEEQLGVLRRHLAA